MFATLVRNRICKVRYCFHCTLCESDIIDQENALKHVYHDEIHCIHINRLPSLEWLNINEQESYKLLNNGIIIIDYKNCKCIWCSCFIPDFTLVSNHIADEKHILQCQAYLDTSVEYTNNIIDNEKNVSVTFEDNRFISLEHHNKMNAVYNETSNNPVVNPTTFCNVPYADQNFYKKFPQSTMVLNISYNYCHECQSTLENNAALLYHKMFHLSQRSNNISDIISFCIKESKKKIYCLLCDYIMNSEKCLERHLTDIGHQKRLLTLGIPNHEVVMNSIYMNSSMYPYLTFPPSMNEMYHTPNIEFNRCSYNVECNPYYDGYQTAAPSYMNEKYGEYPLYSATISPIQFPQSVQPTVDDLIHPSMYFCFMCNMNFIDENQLFLHNFDYNHKYKIDAISQVLKDNYMKFVTFANNEVIKCIKCQIYWTDINGAFNHLYEVQHLTEMLSGQALIVATPSPINNYQLSDIIYNCPVCQKELLNDDSMAQHLESENHKFVLKQYYSNLKSESYEIEKKIYSCPPCNMNFFMDKMLLDHFYTSPCHSQVCNNTHQTNGVALTNPNNKYLTQNKFIINKENSFENPQYFPNNFCNNSKVPLSEKNYNTLNEKTDKNYETKLITESNKENYYSNIKSTIVNRNDFQKNRTKKLINFSPKYVKMCVETGEENIFKVDPEKMEKLLLGISLTFPYETCRGCIPCGCEISSDPQLIYEHLRTEEHEKNLHELEENDEFFENYPDQFSDLKLAKSYMYEDSDEYIKCLACDIEIENENESLSNHISSKTHNENCQVWKKSADEIFGLFQKMFENIWYYIEKFYCNVCCAQFDFEVDFARHLEDAKHFKEVEKRILKKQSLQFDCCIMCACYWYGKSDHHTIHCNRDSHQYILESRSFSVPEMSKDAQKLLTSVEECISSLLEESNKAIQSQSSIEKEILESTEMVVKNKFPNAKAYLFGSRTSSLNTCNGDLDIFLDCKNQYEKISSAEECQEELLIAQECFHKHQDIWIIEEIILRTRVPLIKLRHRFTNLNCDISFMNGLGVEKSKILGYFVSACDPCRKLILYFKKWTASCKLSGTKNITTFAISWLVIFYLQIKKILPSVEHLIKLENKSRIIGGWETGVSREVPVQKMEDSIKSLLKGFFLFYAEFNYISDVACPFLGKIMKKSDFSDIDNLPEEMNIYKSQIKDEQIEFFRLDSPMCIQEPIDLSQNITKAVSKLQLRMFKQYCAESATMIYIP